MKILSCLALLVLAFSLSAQTPEPVPLAHGTVPGEPHHHLKIENEYVRVYYVEVPPHDQTQLHQHGHDYIFVSLGPADVVNAVPDEPEVHLVLKDGETHFTRGGFAHVARNLSDAPFRNVTIEFLHPQDDLRNLCKSVAQGDLGVCNRSDTGPGGYVEEPWFETKELRIDFLQLRRNARFVQRVPAGCLYVVLDESRMQDETGKPAVGLRPGDVFWVPAATILHLRNIAPTASRYLLLTFKSTQQTRVEHSDQRLAHWRTQN
ncbi:MAG: hypothetical protein DMG35_05580 [Acidobacteria bacterium]|nr:MAG: hypothetical protein DMG35_05580 [Acidobacteriota bacterium]